MSDLNCSIIIPVYEDVQGIRNTLKSISELAYDDHNVLVVDNGSKDSTVEEVRKFERTNRNISLLSENQIQGSYAARNKAIQNATGDVLVFLDANEVVNTDWLETAVESMKEQEVDYLGCNVKLTLPQDSLIGRYNAHTGFPIKHYLEQEQYAPTCALLVRREVFEDLGYFDARLISGGDREFGERVHEAGYGQGYAEDATVYHPARISFEALAKKNFRVGRGFCQKQRYYPERYGDPGIPPRPSGPGNSDEEDDELSLTTRLAFAFLSVAMLACRGLGYYYEFFFGEERDDNPPPTS